MPHEHFVALGYLLAVDFGVFGGGAAEVHHGRAPAQDFFHGCVETAVYVFAQLGHFFGVSQQGEHSAAGGVARGFVACHREQQHKGVKLYLAEPVVADGGVDEQGYDVVLRLIRPLFGEVVGEGVKLHGRHSAVFVGVFRVVYADHPVRPVKKPVAVFLRHAHDLGDGLEGQLGCEIHHEVALAALYHLVHDVYGTIAQGFFQLADHARREAFVHEAAIAGVLRRVGGEHHNASGVHAASVGVGVEIKTADAAHFGGEQDGIAVGLDQVGVFGKVPEAGAVGLLVPEDGGFLAQQGEHLVVFPSPEAVQIQKVNICKFHSALLCVSQL